MRSCRVHSRATYEVRPTGRLRVRAEVLKEHAARLERELLDVERSHSEAGRGVPREELHCVLDDLAVVRRWWEHAGHRAARCHT